MEVPQVASLPPVSSGIEVTLKFFPLAFLLLFCTPTVEINGMKHRRSWGTHSFGLAPGQYHVKIYFYYFFMPQCGENSADVTVSPGSVTNITYNMPPWMFAKGSISVW